MCKFVAPVVAALGLLATFSAGPAPAQGRDGPGIPISTKRFHGKLEQKLFSDKLLVPRESGGLPPRAAWQLTVGRKVYTLDFAGNEKLLERARQLAGCLVFVEGSLSAERTIRVVSLSDEEPVWNLPEPILQLLVGLDVGKAREVAREFGYRFRVVMQDGVSFDITMDERPDRINVVVAKGKVVGAHIG
jgi:hypothetical protein